MSSETANHYLMIFITKIFNSNLVSSPQHEGKQREDVKREGRQRENTQKIYRKVTFQY